jgi:hypothetical protein
MVFRFGGKVNVPLCRDGGLMPVTAP